MISDVKEPQAVSNTYEDEKTIQKPYRVLLWIKRKARTIIVYIAVLLLLVGCYKKRVFSAIVQTKLIRRLLKLFFNF